MFTETANKIFNRAIGDYHRWDDVDHPIENPYEPGSLEHLLYHKNWIDTVQWHLEDIIRDPQIDPVAALAIKRRIDKSNQDRTDMVEYIDSYLLDKYKDVETRPDARLNTETPAWAIDRLSILALKIYHMAAHLPGTDCAGKGLRMVLFCLFAVIWRKMLRTWRDDSAAETLPFTPTGEGGLYAPTKQSPKRSEK